MAYIDEATIQAIRNKHPIREVVERYVPLTKKGDDYWGLCPFHADTNASMSVSTRLDMFQCFSCKKAGNIFNFISSMENISYGDAIRLLAVEDGYKVESSTWHDNYTKEYEILNLALKYYQNNFYSNLGQNAKKYLQDRLFDLDTIKKFEIGLSISKQSLTEFLLNKYSLNDLILLGLSNDDGKDIFYDRIMIPIHDASGNPIGFGGRIYQTRDSSKYINTKATKLFDKSNILYNYHRAHTKLKKDESIIIMEGYFDVIRASTIGVNNCVAPMGTSLTKQHINLLSKITNKVILCFDGDNAGENATIHAIELLEKSDIEVKVVRLEEKDPDEFIIKRGKEEFIKKIEHPLNVIDFKMLVLSQGKDLNDINDTSIYLDSLIKELLKTKDELLIELTLKKLSSKFQVEYSTLKSRLDSYKKNIKIVKQVSNEQEFIKNTSKKMPSQYGQAVNHLLYYMVMSFEVMEEAERKVIMILDDKERRLFNEIIYYYHKYGTIKVADFITYLTINTDVSDILLNIISLNLKNNYKLEEIEDYIKCINYYYQKTRIDRLKIDLKKETDPLKQANILSEMMKIRGVKTSD